MPSVIKQEDVSMGDAADAAPAVAEAGDEEMEDYEEDEEEEEEEPYVQKVRLLPGSTDNGASYEILDEGHTLGNVLRYIIMKNPDVEFCAYSIPHPSENKMNLRIQTFPPAKATDALTKGLKDLEDACDVMTEKFIAARDEFMSRQEKADTGGATMQA